MQIRHSKSGDTEAIKALYLQAFGEDEGPVVAKLVFDLLDDPSAQPLLSLAFENDGDLVGHILFTRSIITGFEKELSVQILAPLAVDPGFQKQGIGQQLINEGFKHLVEQGVDLVFVLGHPSYYPKAGFAPAFPHGFSAPFPIPEKDQDAWMVKALTDKGADEQLSGQLQCAHVMNKEEYWRE